MALRFANKNSGTFDVHGPINILQPPVNSLDETSGVIRIGAVSASLMAGPATMSSSLNLSGNVNFNKLQQRDKYNRLLMGTAKRSEFGEAPDPGSSTPYANQYATSPTWTQSAIGLRHGFVSQAISSSEYEVQNLNTYFSGTDNLETTAVPASGNLYYSKQNRFVRLIYKLSASVNLPDIPGNLSLCSTEEYGTRLTGSNHFYPGSGSYRNNDINNPSVFNLYVPDYGKIRDVKVWVEFIHDRRSGYRPSTGSVFLFGGTGTSDYHHYHGLQNICIALRSPNVKFDFAHPLWNAQELRTNFDLELKTYETSSIYRNSYLLWAGHYAENISNVSATFYPGNTVIDQLQNYFDRTILDGGAGLPYNKSDGNRYYPGETSNFTASYLHLNHYAMFDTDIDMRTIFQDSSTVNNYRHRNFLFPSMSLNNLGNSFSVTDPIFGLTASIRSAAVGANANWGANKNGLAVTGYNIPWMLDPRIPEGNLLSNAISYSTVGNVPNGWNTNSVNEFSSSGRQLGPENIKPFYPLLDDIYVKKMSTVPIYLQQDDTSITSFNSKYIYNNLIGFRPGLNGTEINGNWQLLIGRGLSGQKFLSSSTKADQMGYWFRNFRLEFLVEQNYPPNIKSYVNKTNSLSPGIRIHSVISGSRKSIMMPLIASDPNSIDDLNDRESLDLGTNIIYSVEQNNKFGKSFGITDNTGSDYTNHAVFTRITGALAERLTGSGQGALYAYLHNEFGTPYIPLSSGSGNIRDIGSANELAKQKAMISELLLQKPAIKQSQALQAVLSRNNYFETLSQKRQRLLSELNTYEENGFSGSLSSQLLGYFNK